MRLLYFFWSGYIVYLVYSVYTYFKGKHLVSNMEIYNNFFIKKIVLALLILTVSYALKHFGKISLAKWVAGVPLIVFAVPVIGAAIGMLMYWFSMWISGK
jgi:hypothetical protein